MKKLLSVTMVILLLISTIIYMPTSVSAAENNEFVYKLLEDNTVEITEYNGNDDEVTIPEKLDGYTVTKIGDHAFDDATMKSVIIPDTIVSIDWGAFAGCNNIEKIDIPDSVTSVGPYAFYRCEKLTEVSFGSSLKEISTSAFGRSPNIKTFTVDSSNKHFDSRNNCNAIIETATNTLVIGNSCSIIPDTVTTIGTNAFLECYSLEEISIPDSVTTIESMAFGHCMNLSKVKIGNSLKTIEYCGFFNCISLKEINLPESLTTIGDRAFDYCKSLPEISIPANATSIGKEAFTNCYSLNKITVDSENKFYDSRNNCNAIIETAKNTLITGSNNTVFPDTVKEIESKAFYGRNLSQITMSNSVTKIGQYAFYSCTNLKNITIPASVKKIDKEAFGFGGYEWNPQQTEGFTIHGYNNTIAQIYANVHNFKFVSLGNPPEGVDSTPMFDMGDVDGDLSITILDATKVQRHLAYLQELEELFRPYGDLDGDGELRIMDATIIQDIVAHIPPVEP